MEQYFNLYYEYINEDIDYYGITAESLCKLDHEVYSFTLIIM